MEIPATTKDSIKFFIFSSTIVLFFWLVCSVTLFWNSPYQTISLYECRWLLSSLGVACFFSYLFMNGLSSALYTAAHVSTQYCLVYSTVSTLINTFNVIHVLLNWQDTATGYLRILIPLIFFAFISALLAYYLLTHLIEFARDWEPRRLALRHNQHIVHCSVTYFVLALVNFIICMSVNENAPYASSFIVQQFCCTCLSISVAWVQWKFMINCNTHILRAVVITIACQFVQELTYAYNTYQFILLISPNDTAGKMSTGEFAKLQRLLIFAFAIHGIRLILCIYALAQYGGAAFPDEVWSLTTPFQAFPNGEPNRIQNREAINAALKEAKGLCHYAIALIILCVSTDIAYVEYGYAKRIDGTGISLIYAILTHVAYLQYRNEQRSIFLKLAAVLSISMLGASVHTIYVFIESMLNGHLYDVMTATFADGVINATYFFLAVALTVLSIQSAMFSFQMITKCTPLYTQPTAITRPLRWMSNISYTFIAVIAGEILFTLMMQVIFSIQIDLILSTEVFLWIGSLSTCFLQIWVSRHERFQQCLVILIIQLIVDCSTTVPLIMVQAGIVQTVISLMQRHGKSFQNVTARITYAMTDHILQIVQWLLSIGSLGLALIVLGEMETGEGSRERTEDNSEFAIEYFSMEDTNEARVGGELQQAGGHPGGGNDNQAAQAVPMQVSSDSNLVVAMGINNDDDDVGDMVPILRNRSSRDIINGEHGFDGKRFDDQQCSIVGADNLGFDDRDTNDVDAHLTVPSLHGADNDDIVKDNGNGDDHGDGYRGTKDDSASLARQHDSTTDTGINDAVNVGSKIIDATPEPEGLQMSL